MIFKIKFGTKINIQTGQIVKGVYLAPQALPTHGVHLVQLQKEILIREHGPASVQPDAVSAVENVPREGCAFGVIIWLPLSTELFSSLANPLLPPGNLPGKLRNRPWHPSSAPAPAVSATVLKYWVYHKLNSLSCKGHACLP